MPAARIKRKGPKRMMTPVGETSFILFVYVTSALSVDSGTASTLLEPFDASYVDTAEEAAVYVLLFCAFVPSVTAMEVPVADGEAFPSTVTI